MPDGTSSSSSAGAARRGPPPVPRANVEPSTLPGTASDSPLEELLALVTAEAEATDSKKRGADLRARAALLHIAAHGDAVKALALIEKVDHPLVPAIKLAAALESKDGADEKLMSA